MRGSFVFVRDRRIFYRSAGDFEKPKLFILGGLGMSSSVFSAIGKRLAKDFFVIIPDLPGFGQSDGISGDHHFMKMADAIYDLTVRLEIDEAIFIGHSMGGAVGIRLMEQWPKVVSKLILVDATSIPLERSVFGWGFQAVRKTIRSLNHPVGLLKIVTSFADNVTDHPSAMLRAFEQIRNFDVHIMPKVPVCVIWGEKDEYYPFEAVGQKLADFYQVPLTIVKNAGHDWLILHPDLFVATLRTKGWPEKDILRASSA